MLLPQKIPHPYEAKARELRLDLLNLVYESGAGHIGGSLSSLDILIALYFSDIFNLDKDRLVVSAGHYAPALYVVLAELGFFPKYELKKYGHFGSFLETHISTEVPGVHYSSGSLGQGLSFAAGLAYADPTRTAICLTSDGEHDEGQIWEAALFANKYHLGNLVNIVDLNGIQIDGTTRDIMPLDELAAKYIRFGWTVTTIDGHNYKDLIRALKRANHTTIYPSCIIAKTTFGKGISFMENDFNYHHVRHLSESLYLKAKEELTL